MLLGRNEQLPTANRRFHPFASWTCGCWTRARGHFHVARGNLLFEPKSQSFIYIYIYICVFSLGKWATHAAVGLRGNGRKQTKQNNNGFAGRCKGWNAGKKRFCRFQPQLALLATRFLTSKVWRHLHAPCAWSPPAARAPAPR